MKTAGTGTSTIIFDGYCNFCSGAVRFIVKRDERKVFRFAASQSEAGQEIIHNTGLGQISSRSIVLISNGDIYSRSDAVLRIAKQLGGIWPLLYIFRFLPRWFRDFIYRVIAAMRYRIGGRRESCFMPDKAMLDRFI